MRLSRLLAEGAVLPAPEHLELDAAGSRDALREWYRGEAAGVRIDLVQSLDGSAQGLDGTSETLSSGADRAVLGAIRAESDVVLIGARSFRAEGPLLPRRARLAVLTRSGELGGAAIPPGGPASSAVVTVLAPATAEARVRATLEGVELDFAPLPEAGAAGVDLGAALDALRDRGLPRIVCEGGPSLAAALIDAGRVDELCLSTAAAITGTGVPALGAPGPRGARLRQLAADELGNLYTRWAL
ncbi:dihydrofolate reductase family protein [Homoserinibacter sp. YIM 151385]|uniref:dihydrofolate reductase family protein n=1 Tax=Homoserinibacter sp. YIM 151385 TaxID=2985506 RepID=UPI0022F06C46|nr:dihydrofolate reductase family protein [Homoserinibacter sp. YIM 151385]WBU38517.1 dihydrofolate reductase family protein [Homoserinibacter sp. YIM 151385]